jgi:uncharacterized protein YigE (DUF2233 family)
MKKFIFIFFAILILSTIAFFYHSKTASSKIISDNVLSAVDTPTASPNPWKQSIIIKGADFPVRISWAIVNLNEVELYDNLKEQKLSEEIKLDKNCQILVNGGFYSKENTHLGLFITNSEIISYKIISPLLNGFLTIKSNNVSIDDNFKDINPRIGLQSGPLLIRNNKTLLLKINNDEPNRRIVVGVTDNKLIFLAVYKDGSIYQGPLLGQLPGILGLFEKQTGIYITDAINLDGGSASVFISNYDRLNELAHIGSYFCIK